MYHIGFDLGGTKLKTIVLDSSNQVIFNTTAPTPMFGPKTVYDIIHQLYHLALEKIPSSNYTIGIGIPGNIARPSYLLEGTDVHHELMKIFNHDYKIENDANCFTLAESILGAGKDSSSVFGIILGTGVGGGLVINNKLYTGYSGLAGEWGHTPLITNGKACWCGQKGCVEQYISGRAIEKIYRESSGIIDKTATEVFNTNDIVSLCIKEDFYNHLAQGIATVINYYDPEVIVIGGGLSNYDEIYSIVPGKVENLIFNTKLNTRIVKATLKNDSGALGAALLCQ